MHANQDSWRLLLLCCGNAESWSDACHKLCENGSDYDWNDTGCQVRYRNKCIFAFILQNRYYLPRYIANSSTLYMLYFVDIYCTIQYYMHKYIWHFHEECQGLNHVQVNCRLKVNWGKFFLQCSHQTASGKPKIFFYNSLSIYNWLLEIIDMYMIWPLGNPALIFGYNLWIINTYQQHTICTIDLAIH